MEFKLGSRLKDVVTGFQGIATSRIEYINGCIQYCLVPNIGTDGKYPEGQYVDIQRLEKVDDGVNIVAKATGGPSSRGEAPPVR